MTEKLLTAFLTRNAIRINSLVLEHFWETSTRRAMAMTHIARELYGVDADLAYTCGLFYHVGIPILTQGVNGYAGTLTEALARQDRSFTDTENTAHRTDHAVVGPWWRALGACPARFTRQCACTTTSRCCAPPACHLR